MTGNLKYLFDFEDYRYRVDCDGKVWRRNVAKNKHWECLSDCTLRYLIESARFAIDAKGRDGFRFKIGTLEDFLNERPR